jgi:hypothetical protein
VEIELERRFGGRHLERFEQRRVHRRQRTMEMARQLLVP